VKHRLLLVGCGHAHLFVLEALAHRPIRGATVTLVSPDDEYYYSGMIPGVLAGQYHPEQARFVPPRLARAAGADWVCARVTRIDPARNIVELDSGKPLTYDTLSLNIGARLRGSDRRDVRAHASPVRPMSRALELVPRILGAPPADERNRSRVVVVGGGAAGVELAFCLHTALRLRGGAQAIELVLVSADDRILPEYPESFRARARALLADRGIRTLLSAEVDLCGPGWVHLSDGTRLDAQTIVWATGPQAPSLFRDSGLPLDEQGYLAVTPTLRSPADANVFGAGDCVGLIGYPWVAKAGVYAVREGPILAENLRRQVENRPLRRYRPQRRWLSLMNTGGGSALLHYRGRAMHGSLAWKLKTAIDERFVSRFRALEREADPAPTSLPGERS
jgi:selenide, water dikinase